jgi:hypothetical protein
MRPFLEVTLTETLDCRAFQREVACRRRYRIEYRMFMEEAEYIAKARSQLSGAVGPNQAAPRPDEFTKVHVRETMLVNFESDSGKKRVFVLLDRATGEFVAAGSNDRGGAPT